MRKLCIIYNFAQKYREPIYKLIDKEWNCEWYFGTNETDIKGFDIHVLQNAKEVKNITIKSALTYQKGILPLLWRSENTHFLMLGDFNCISTWLMLISKKLFARKKKIYLWTHGWYGREGLIKKFMKHIFFSASDGVFLYGNYARKLMIKAGFDSDKLFVIHNSLDYDNQKSLRDKLHKSNIYHDHFKNDNPNLIFIGRLTKIKRIDLLIEALAILLNKGYHYNLTLIGDGSEMESLRNMVSQKKLDEVVWFYGACYDESRNGELIYNADLCVAPGNVGLTAMHTMAFGTPVLTHDNYPMQMPEFEAIEKNKSGAFFKYNDADSLSDAIIDWFKEHYNERNVVRKNCINIIENSWNPNFQLNIFKDRLN